MMDFFPQNGHPQTRPLFVGGDLFPREQRHFRGEKAAGSDFERKDSVRAEWLRLLP
jgi:hypothetical protein